MTQDQGGPPPNQGWAPPPGGPPQQPSYGQQYGYGQGYPPNPPMPDFFISRMGTQEGPYSFTDLQAQARSGLVRVTTMVHRADGQGGWFGAGEVPGLFSDKDWVTTVVISFLLGSFGIDRFYLGYTTLGVLKLITCGGCGIWWLIDLILIAMDQLPDVYGRPLRKT